VSETGVATVTELALTVIVPARNEADVLGPCLASLVGQSEPGWELGEDWEVIVVDDGSTDATRAVAEAVVGVKVLEAPALTEGDAAWFTGKNNACWAGAQAARGRLLVFTDADTLHTLGSLSRARHELEKYVVGMLSYSPKQLTSGLAQQVLMPLVFAELALAYPMKRVNALEDKMAAANGQFIMVVAEDYFDVGGHKGVGLEVLEDVALAKAFKRRKKGLRFRYAPDALSTRMYRTTGAMIEGWTKNLALLFGSPVVMAAMRLLDLLLIVGLPALAILYPFDLQIKRTLILLVWVRVLWRFYARVAKSNFSAVDCAVSVVGLPLFCFLLVRSAFEVRIRRKVEWKGRSYRTGA
jgi:hypothetical protein